MRVRLEGQETRETFSSRMCVIQLHFIGLGNAKRIILDQATAFFLFNPKFNSDQ